MHEALNNNNISIEMIESQIGDPVVVELENAYQELIDTSKLMENKLNSGLDYYVLKNTKDIITRIDDIITKRFGITFKHANNNSGIYAVLPVPPKNFNVLNTNLEEIYETMETILSEEYKDVNIPTDLSDVDINDTEKDSALLFAKILSSQKLLEKTMNAGGVKIDLKKAKIMNLDKDYTIYLLTDFSLVRELDFTAKELTAILLHEVGHAFTGIEYSFRTLLSTSVLIDSLRENINKKGKSFTNALNIVFKNNLNGDKDISKEKPIDAMVYVMDKYMEQTLSIDYNNPSLTNDVEQLADQFASRFGMGFEIVSSVQRINAYNTARRSKESMSETRVINFIVTVYALGIIGLLTGSILIPVLTIFIKIFLARIVDVLFMNGIKTDASYIEDKKRYEQALIDAIRQLRNADIDAKSRTILLDIIDSIDNVIKKTVFENPSMMALIAGYIIPYSRTAIRRMNFNDMVEKLTENKLHLAKAKFKQATT